MDRFRVLEAKLYYAKEKFADVGFVGAYRSDSADGKIDILKRIASERGLENDEILLIEDHPITINTARDAGFSAISIMEVAYMVSEEMFK